MSDPFGPTDTGAAAPPDAEAPAPLDRRSFLVWAAAGATVAAFGLAAGTAAQALLPPERSVDGKRQVGRITVARITELTAGQPVVAEYGDDVVFVLKTGPNAVRVFNASCPHLGCTLTFDRATRHFVCPCHHSVFDLDGRKLSGPAPRGLVPADAEVVGSDVVVSGFAS